MTRDLPAWVYRSGHRYEVRYRVWPNGTKKDRQRVTFATPEEAIAFQADTERQWEADRQAWLSSPEVVAERDRRKFDNARQRAEREAAEEIEDRKHNWVWFDEGYFPVESHTARKPWDCVNCDLPFFDGEHYFGWSSWGHGSVRCCAVCMPEEFPNHHGHYGTYDEYRAALAAGPGLRGWRAPGERYSRDLRAALRQAILAIEALERGQTEDHFMDDDPGWLERTFGPIPVSKEHQRVVRAYAVAQLKVCLDGGIATYDLTPTLFYSSPDRARQALLRAAHNLARTKVPAALAGPTLAGIDIERWTRRPPWDRADAEAE